MAGSRTLNQFAYPDRDRRQRGLLRRFIERVTGCSRAQVNRLIAPHRDNHSLTDRRKRTRRPLCQALRPLPRSPA